MQLDSKYSQLVTFTHDASGVKSTEVKLGQLYSKLEASVLSVSFLNTSFPK